MVWTGLHVAQHASANVFSIRCLISRELASDEACWQHNGRENLRRLHQMAALLRHLGQNLVDDFYFWKIIYPQVRLPRLLHIERKEEDEFTLTDWEISHHHVVPPRPGSIRYFKEKEVSQITSFPSPNFSSYFILRCWVDWWDNFLLQVDHQHHCKPKAGPRPLHRSLTKSLRLLSCPGFAITDDFNVPQIFCIWVIN